MLTASRTGILGTNGLTVTSFTNPTRFKSLSQLVISNAIAAGANGWGYQNYYDSTLANGGTTTEQAEPKLGEFLVSGTRLTISNCKLATTEKGQNNGVFTAAGSTGTATTIRVASHLGGSIQRHGLIGDLTA